MLPGIRVLYTTTCSGLFKFKFDPGNSLFKFKFDAGKPSYTQDLCWLETAGTTEAGFLLLAVDK